MNPILNTNAKNEPFGWYTNLFVYACLPHSKLESREHKIEDPWHTTVYQVNPLVIDDKTTIGKFIPYGSMSRILITWMIKELVRNSTPNPGRADVYKEIREVHYPNISDKEWNILKLRILPLPSKQSNFVEELGYLRQGGVNGDMTRLREHLLSLLGLYVSVIPKDKGYLSVSREFLVERFSVWYKEDDKGPYFIQLSSSLANAINDKAWPYLIGALKYLRSSALAMDLYWWIIHKQATLQNSPGPGLKVSYFKLMEQFGGYSYDPDKKDLTQGKRDFKKKLRLALENIYMAYPQVKDSIFLERDYIFMKKTELPVAFNEEKK